MNDLQLALIDMGLFWAFWHKSKTEPAGTARDRFVGMVRAISLRHTRTIVCGDSPVLFRRQIPGGEGYKRRPDKTPEERAEVADAERLIRELGIPLVTIEGYEADDLLASFAQEGERAGWYVRIYSDDKDLEACVTAGVSVCKRDRDKSGIKDWTAEDVKNRRGCMPARVPELLALMGDSADSIPGVTGIGEEAAKAVLAAYPTLFAAYDDVAPDGTPGAALPERTRKALAAGRSSLEVSYALTKLDMTAVNKIDRGLLVPPKVGPPPTAASPAREEPKAAPVEREERRGDKAVLVQELQREALAEVIGTAQGRSMLDEIAASAAQKAAIEGWVPRKFEESLEPRNLADLQWLAAYLDRAMVPGRGQDAKPVRLFAKKGNENAIFAIILKGRELNLPAMLSLAHIQIVEGKAEVDAMLMIALAIRSGIIEWFRFEKSDDKEAIAVCKHVRHPDPERMSFTMDEADAADLGMNRNNQPDPYSPWQKWRKVMLRWRAATLLLRAVAPEAVTGLWVTGEVSEMGEDDVRRGLNLESKVMT